MKKKKTHLSIFRLYIAKHKDTCRLASIPMPNQRFKAVTALDRALRTGASSTSERKGIRSFCHDTEDVIFKEACLLRKEYGVQLRFLVFNAKKHADRILDLEPQEAATAPVFMFLEGMKESQKEKMEAQQEYLRLLDTLQDFSVYTNLGGGEHCKACKSRNVKVIPVQKRRSDEPMTMMCECLNPECNKSWQVG